MSGRRGAYHALLARWSAHPARHPEGETRGVWGTDCVRTECTIGERFRPGIRREEPAPDDPVRGGLPGPGNCRIAATTIRLDTLPAAPSYSGSSQARFLRGNVPGGELEHPYAPAEDSVHALRAHGAFPEAGQIDPP